MSSIPRQSRGHRVTVAPEGHARLVVDMSGGPRWSPGKAAAGRAMSTSVSASSPTVGQRWPALFFVLAGIEVAPGGRSRASPVLDQKRSRLSWASALGVAVMVRHQRPQQNFTPHSTAPFRFPRRGGHGVTMAP